MSEKRFQWVYIKDNILELRDDGVVKTFNNERLEEFLNNLVDENEHLKDKVYEEMDDTLAVLVELYEYVPFDSRKKMNKLYNRLKSLRDDMNG